MSVFYRDGRSASKLVDDLLGKGSFDFPKNPEVLQEWIGAITQNDDIILDSFAGSGTTAQAVLQLNPKNSQDSCKNGCKVLYLN